MAGRRQPAGGAPVPSLVFPGQGVQRAGMARDFYDRFAEARTAFEEASDAVGLDVAALCFEPNERLDLTEFAQPAIVTAEAAMTRVLAGPFGVEAGHFGGHSLGEYSALVAAGVIALGEAVRLVRERGRLMQEAVPVGRGAMKAVVQRGLDAAALAAELTGLDVDVANHNSPDQVVISGPVDALDEAVGRLRAAPAFARARALDLRVSAPFHSRHMEGAAVRFRPLLQASAAAWDVEHAPLVTSNTTGGFHRPDRDALVDALARQIVAPVRWLDNMRALAACSGDIVEVGPGKPLRAFFARLDVDVTAVTDVASAEAALGPPSDGGCG